MDGDDVRTLPVVDLEVPRPAVVERVEPPGRIGVRGVEHLLGDPPRLRRAVVTLRRRPCGCRALADERTVVGQSAPRHEVVAPHGQLLDGHRVALGEALRTGGLCLLQHQAVRRRIENIQMHRPYAHRARKGVREIHVHVVDELHLPVGVAVALVVVDRLARPQPCRRCGHCQGRSEASRALYQFAVHFRCLRFFRYHAPHFPPRQSLNKSGSALRLHGNVLLTLFFLPSVQPIATRYPA